MRLQFLDSARAIAVLYVIFFHMLGIWHLDYPSILTKFVQFGGSGVILFFLVSGFSLCLTMNRHLESESPNFSYSVARVFRIVPLYYILLVVTIFRDIEYRNMTHEPEKILSAIFFVFNFFPEYAKGIVWASWTIGVEVIFYAIFPFLHKYLNSIEKRLIAVIFITWCVYFINLFLLPNVAEEFQRSYSYMNFPRNLAIFLWGMVTYDIYNLLVERNIARRKELGSLLIVFGFSLLAYLAIAARYTWNKTLVVDFGLLQAMAYSVLVLGLSLNPWRLFVNSVGTFYSRVCYSAYLWHPMVIWAMKPIYDYIYLLAWGSWSKLLISFILTLMTVSAISAISYQLIELPGQQLGRVLLKMQKFKKNKLAVNSI